MAVNPKLAFPIFALALTYPIERWPVPARLDNPEERDRFFDAILASDYVSACKSLGMARGSVYRYRREHPEFEDELRAVFEDLYHDLGFQSIRLADDARKEGRPEMAALVRNQIDARLRTRGHHKPPPVEVNVDNRTQTINLSGDADRAALIAQRERALSNKNESK